MKHFAAAALALSLLGGASAFAEPPQSGAHPGGGHPGGGAPTGGQHPGGGAPTGGQRPGGGAPTGGQRSGGGAPTGGQTYRGPTGGAPSGGAPTGGQRPSGPTGGAPTYRPGGYRGPGAGGGAPTGGQRPSGGRPGFTPLHNGGSRVTYNVRIFPRVVNVGRRYNWGGPRWYGQPGYYYRHWGYGDRLPYGWFVADFFISDYWDYGLSDPPWGYEWVRVGPDALLVDVNTGMVVESAYGIFY
jgi:Ni/Co efflux regulator RcnB